MFVMEIEIQCDLALNAFDSVKKGIDKFADPKGDPFEIGLIENFGSPVLIIRDSQSLLNHAAIVSRFLFPETRTNKKVVSRCAKMSFLIGIKRSPILEDLGVRNSFEHVDERMDKFFGNLKLPASYAPISVDYGQKPTKAQPLRLIVRDSLELSFVNKKVQLSDLATEVKTVKGKAKDAIRKLAT